MRAAAEAVPGENVVFQRKCVMFWDLGAVDLLYSVGFLDTAHDPPRTRESFICRHETLAGIRSEDHSRSHAGRYEVHSEYIRIDLAVSPPHRLGDPVSLDPQLRRGGAHPFQIGAVAAVQHYRAVLGDMPVGRQIASEKAEKIAIIFVERREVLHVRKSVPTVDADIGSAVIGTHFLRFLT